MTYALDTNIIIDYLNGNAAAMTQFHHIAKNKTHINIPSIVNYEVLRGFYYTPSHQKETIYSKLRLNCPVIEVNTEIWNCAASIWAKLRKQGRSVSDADNIIAALCIVNGYTLVTHNIKHFTGIDGLLFEDWI
jgi:predicted nucleic acid-binding protein